MNDRFRSRGWCSCYDRAGVVNRPALDWLVVKLLVLEPGRWNDVDFRVEKQVQMRWILWTSTTAAVQDLALHVDDKSH